MSGLRDSDPTIEDALFRIGTRWIRPLSEYQFAVVELTAEADIEAVCRIFEKVNSTGQQLTLFELLTARFWVKGIDLRSLWFRAQSQYVSFGDFEIDPTYLLQVVAYLARVPEPGRPSAVFALTSDQINAHWESAVRGMYRAIKLLQTEFGVMDKQWLPYGPMLMPLAAIQAERSADAREESEGRLLRLHRWFWCSIFGGAYEQGAAATAARDYLDMRVWLDDPLHTQPPAGVRDFTGFDAGRLRSISRKGQAAYRACVAIMLRRNPRDLFSGEPLYGAGKSVKTLQRMAIFPKPELGPSVPKELRDSILNTMIVRTRRAGAQTSELPSAYLRTARASVGDHLPEILEEHLIPAGDGAAIWTDKFYDIIRDREEWLSEEIRSLTGEPEGAE